MSEPTVVELVAVLAALRDEVAMVRAAKGRLQARVLELETQLRANFAGTPRSPRRRTGWGNQPRSRLRKRSGRKPEKANPPGRSSPVPGRRQAAREARHEVCSRLIASSDAFTKAAQADSSVHERLLISTSMVLSSLLATA